MENGTSTTSADCLYHYGPFGSIRQMRDQVGDALRGSARAIGAIISPRDRRVHVRTVTATQTLKLGSGSRMTIGNWTRTDEGLVLHSGLQLRGLDEVARPGRSESRPYDPTRKPPLTWRELQTAHPDALPNDLSNRGIQEEVLDNLANVDEYETLGTSHQAALLRYLMHEVATFETRPAHIERLTFAPSFEVLKALVENPRLPAKCFEAVIDGARDLAPDDHSWEELLMLLAVHGSVRHTVKTGVIAADFVFRAAKDEKRLDVLELLVANEAIDHSKRVGYHDALFVLAPKRAGPAPVLREFVESPEVVHDWEPDDVLGFLAQHPESTPVEVAEGIGARDISGISSWMRDHKEELPAKPKPAAQKPKTNGEAPKPFVAPRQEWRKPQPVQAPQPKPKLKQKSVSLVPEVDYEMLRSIKWAALGDKTETFQSRWGRWDDWGRAKKAMTALVNELEAYAEAYGGNIGAAAFTDLCRCYRLKSKELKVFLGFAKIGIAEGNPALWSELSEPVKRMLRFGDALANKSMRKARRA